MARVLLTGGAGFIGSHVLDALVGRGLDVTVVDDLDPYYDPAIKRENLGRALASGRVGLVEADLCDPGMWAALPLDGWTAVIHLAARAGVRPSIEDPARYLHANVTGTGRVLDWAARRGVPVLYASSSSVYGDGYPVPFAEDAAPLRPVSPYGASKVATEVLAQTWSRMVGLRAVGLRVFTVYGPRQRPDLAIHKFAARIDRGETIPVYGDGSTARDYTHVTDIVAGVIAAFDGLLDGGLPHDVYNLGTDEPVRLDAMIASIERALGKDAAIDRQPEQLGDVKRTWADISRARADLGYEPLVSFDEGIDDFVAWLRR